MFEQLRRGCVVSSSKVKTTNGVSVFKSGNQTITLRPDSQQGKSISIKTDNNPQQIIIRFCE